MQLGEVYKLKESCEKNYLEEIILISHFANRHYEEDGELKRKMIFVAESFMDEEILYCSSLHVTYFESEEEILKDYELLMTQKEYGDHIRSKGY